MKTTKSPYFYTIYPCMDGRIYFRLEETDLPPKILEWGSLRKSVEEAIKERNLDFQLLSYPQNICGHQIYVMVPNPYKEGESTPENLREHLSQIFGIPMDVLCRRLSDVPDV